MRRTRQVWLLLGCAAAIALAVRWPQLDESLWLDELHTAWCAGGSWSEVYERSQIGNHSPLYFYLAWSAAKLAGLQETVLRFPSLVAGMLLVVAVGVFVWQWTKSAGASFFAAVLVALDPVCIFYSQEARPYACLLFLAWCHVAVVVLLSQTATFEIERATTGNRLVLWRVLFVLGAVLLIYLHYTAALFVCAEVIFLLGMALRRSRMTYAVRQLVWDVMIIAVACVPAALHLQSILSHGNAWKSFVPDPSLTVLFQQSRLATHLTWPVVGVIAVLAWNRSFSRLSVTRDRQAFTLVTTVLVLPLAVAWFATEVGLAQVLFRRYLLPTYVAGILLASFLWASIPHIGLRVVVAILTLGMSLSSSGIAQRYFREGKILDDRRQDWRSAVHFVNAHADAHTDLAFVRGGFLEADRLAEPHAELLDEYNLAPVNNIYRLKVRAKPIPTSERLWSPLLEQEIGELSSRSCWLVFNCSVARRREFFDALERAHVNVTLQREFGTVLVCRVAPQSPHQRFAE